MRLKLLIVPPGIIVFLALVGCYANIGVRLYPVQGPLATQTPLPVFPANFTERPSGGDISFTLPGGEACKGQFQRVKPESGPKGESTTNAMVGDGMATVWDSVYGPGFYVGHVLGNHYHRSGEATGDRGTVLRVEFVEIWESEAAHARGVARDNQGNIYKIVFDR